MTQFYFNLQEIPTCTLFPYFDLIWRNPTLPFQPNLRGQGSFGLQPHPRGYYDMISLPSDELSSKDIGFRTVFPLAERRKNHICNTTNPPRPVLFKPRLHPAFWKIKLSSDFSKHNGTKPWTFSARPYLKNTCVRLGSPKLNYSNRVLSVLM